ncbi:hypothetical protein ACFC1R_36605 [Kitasatospora sp. NPDC056138]
MELLSATGATDLMAILKAAVERTEGEQSKAPAAGACEEDRSEESHA